MVKNNEAFFQDLQKRGLIANYANLEKFFKTCKKKNVR